MSFIGGVEVCGWVVPDPHRLCGEEPSGCYRLTAPTERIVQTVMLLCSRHVADLEERGFLVEELVSECAPIRKTPTVRVESCDGAGI